MSKNRLSDAERLRRRKATTKRYYQKKKRKLESNRVNIIQRIERNIRKRTQSTIQRISIKYFLIRKLIGLQMRLRRD